MGLTEKAAREAGHEVRIGKFPFIFSGRALASDETEGFVKLVFDTKYGELLGAHLIGSQATELIAELVMAKKLEATEEEILHAMHPHPTYSEAVMEAAGQGLGESVHIRHWRWSGWRQRILAKALNRAMETLSPRRPYPTRQRIAEFRNGRLHAGWQGKNPAASRNRGCFLFLRGWTISGGSVRRSSARAPIAVKPIGGRSPGPDFADRLTLSPDVRSWQGNRQYTAG